MKRHLRWSFKTPITLATLALVSAVALNRAQAQPPLQSTESSAELAEATPPTPTETRLAPVPPILRMHLPVLGEKTGVLFVSVGQGSGAEQLGFLDGDILVEAGGKAVVAGESLDQLDPTLPIVVIRRGRVQVFNQPGRPVIPDDQFGGERFGPRAFAQSLKHLRQFRRPAMQPMNGMLSSSTAVSASSAGGRTVSISRAGDQISLEMSLPELEQNPIRLQGTREQIEGELQASGLSDAAKREVLQTLQGVR